MSERARCGHEALVPLSLVHSLGLLSHDSFIINRRAWLLQQLKYQHNPEEWGLSLPPNLSNKYSQQIFPFCASVGPWPPLNWPLEGEEMSIICSEGQLTGIRCWIVSCRPLHPLKHVYFKYVTVQEDWPHIWWVVPVMVPHIVPPVPTVTQSLATGFILANEKTVNVTHRACLLVNLRTCYGLNCVCPKIHRLKL